MAFQDASADELLAVADAVVRNMVIEHQYLSKGGDALDFADGDELEFTHLAPSI